MLYGIGGSNEEINDYIQNYINIENYPLVFNGYQLNNMGSLINNSYFSQTDALFNSLANNPYNYHPYNLVYNNYSAAPYMDNQQKGKII